MLKLNLLALSAAIVASFTLAPASASAGLGATLFRDDFSSGSFSLWKNSPLGLAANWSVVSDRAHYNGGGHTQIYAGSPTWRNYQVSTKFQIASLANYPGGLRGRVDTASGKSYVAWIYPSENRIALGRTGSWHIDSSGYVLLANATVPTISANVDHTLTLRFNGDLIEVDLDGNNVISTYDSALRTGAIAFDVSSQPIDFDDVTVQSIIADVPANDGPGGPILVIGDKENPFSRYMTEILNAEGLRYFLATDVTKVTTAMLADHDVAILDEVSLTAAQVTILTNWVQNGGNLIAMKPDRKLAPLLGVKYVNGTISDGYIHVLNKAPIGTGIVNTTRMQFHGTADRPQLLAGQGAVNLVTLHSTSASPDAFVGLSLRPVGANGGQAAAFAYGLGRSVVLTRQGNPAWSGQNRDGMPPIRSNDLFFGNAINDPKPDWVDFERIQIPQADEQQRLLRKLIAHMNQNRKPLPSFWYLPRMLKATVVMTGDDHASNGTAPRFDQYQSLSPASCSLANWQCVRGTSYVFINTPLPDVAAKAYVDQGFEIGLHVNTNCQDATQPNLVQAFSSQLPIWKIQYVSLPNPTTNRNHCIAWAGYASPAVDSLKYGIRLDTNYYYWPAQWVQDRPGLFTGSGFPMRFAHSDGTKINVYQAATQMTDESGLTYETHINTLLDNALGAKGYYAVITANMHTDLAPSPGSDAIIQAAQAKSVPVISAKQMLEWLDQRNKATFGTIAWANNTLTFKIANNSNVVPNLQGMVPTKFGALKLVSVQRGATNLAIKKMTVKGVQYAFFTGINGIYQATYQ